MTEFSEWPGISSYNRQQAVEAGILVEVLRWDGSALLATRSVREDLSLSEIYSIWHEFTVWDDLEGRRPEDNLFTAVRYGRKIWLVEDLESYVLLYSHEY